MEIVNYSIERSKAIAELFTDSVHHIDSAIYSETEKQAWAPTPIDYQLWEKRLSKTKPYLLLIENEVAGFVELEPDGHIDCFYVLPKFQGQGVAKNLLKHIISLADQAGLKQLTVEASIVAKPLFEKFGFVSIKKNKIQRSGVVLINYSMVLSLGTS